MWNHCHCTSQENCLKLSFVSRQLCKTQLFFYKTFLILYQGWKPHLKPHMSSCPGCANLIIKAQTPIFQCKVCGELLVWIPNSTKSCQLSLSRVVNPWMWVWIKWHHPLAGTRDTQQSREPLGVIPNFGNTNVHLPVTSFKLRLWQLQDVLLVWSFPSE